MSLKEARYYEKLDRGYARCLLCPHFCRIGPGRRGICQGRENRAGSLYASNYGECVSLALDPIEKKPLYHFHPGSVILSTAPNGCNLSCRFCQNADISQGPVPTRYLPPEDLAGLAAEGGSIGVSFTYTEPLIWFEYLLDAGAIIHQRGLKNVLVTNGMINEEPLRELLPLIDAMNVDLKSMEEDFYRRVCGGHLREVLRTIEISKQHCLVEVTNLVIPGLNDTTQQLRRLIDWVAGLGADTPLHFSRYFPHYRMRAPATPVETLRMAWEMAREKLRYVYVGNAHIEGASDTRCHGCSNVLIARQGYVTTITGIGQGRCAKCGAKAEAVL
jgi:pyruvate formate lyase activating enzyme